MTALVMAALAGVAVSVPPVVLSARQRWSEAHCRALITSPYRRAAQVVSSAALVDQVERAAHADAVRHRAVSRSRRSYAAHAARPAAVAARARARRRLA